MFRPHVTILFSNMHGLPMACWCGAVRCGAVRGSDGEVRDCYWWERLVIRHKSSACVFIAFLLGLSVGRDSSASTATRYGLEGPAIESL